MWLDEVPMALLLLGLVAYAVLGGADFGAGFWYLLSGKGERGRDLRDHAHHAMGPVWEANHVWLIFVLVIAWTAYPTAFGSIASTLVVPLFVAAIGIIVRGTAYALKSQSATRREEWLVGGSFAASSVLTPFALGAVVGGIASGRVPVGNASGDLLTSWLNPTSLVCGLLAVANGVYLAAVYLAADAVRLHRPELAEAFRRRALAAALVTGGLGAVGLVVVRSDADLLRAGETRPLTLAAVGFSALAGATAIVFLQRRRFEAARVCGAAAVAGVIAGWAFAQRPFLLTGLDVHQAAAARPTLIAVIVAAAGGMVILAPSLGLLFGLVLRGRLDAEDEHGEPAQPQLHGTAAAVAPAGERRLGAVAAACLAVGLVGAALDPDWARALSVVGLLGFAASAFVWLAGPAE